MAELSSKTKDHARKTPRPTASTAGRASVNPEGPELGMGVPEEGLVARHAALVGDPRLGSATGGQRMRLVQRLQRGYAIPSPKPAAETSMTAGPAQVNQEMSQAGVTEDQLKKSNEPAFTDAAAAKRGAEANSATAPGEYRAAENQTMNKAGTDAKGAAAAGLQGMHGQRTGALGAVGGDKGGAKTKDEAKRAEVASKIEGIFSQTKIEVSAILEGLDGKVNTAFDSGEKSAREQFESYVDQKMSKYKRDRYLGAFGPELWLKDKLMGMPSEVNAFYQDGRNLYLKQMEGVISRVADVVGGELGKAKARIALGKQQIKEFVASQPKELQQVAKDAEQQIGSKFDELEGEVNSKRQAREEVPVVGRPWQVFVAPGADADPLPVDQSPWHDGRWVKIPREQWEVILDFGQKFDRAALQSLHELSWSRDPESIIRASPESLRAAASFLERLRQEVLKAEPLVPHATEEVPDEYENVEHARMLESVEAVIRESLRSGQPFRAWVE